MFNPHANNQIFVSTDNKVFDISTLVDSIQHATVLEGQAGKLTFQMQKNPTPEVPLNIKNGSVIQFKRDNKGIFFGYVFNMGMDANGIIQVTAYDQMRYLKNEDTVYISNMKVSDVFNMLCTNHNLKNFKVVTPCDFVCPNKKYEGQTLFSILQHQMHQANIASKGTKYYYIRDNFGTLEFTELHQTKTDIMIGYKSLLSSFQFEISIDKNTYNSIKVVKSYNSEDEKGKKSDNKIISPYTAKDSNTQRKWGFLQKVISVDDKMNSAQLIQYADDYMKSFNRETKTLKLSALGVDEINAGSGFSVYIPELNTYKLDDKGQANDKYLDMWAVGANHTYSRDMHTMELDVATPF